MIDQRSTLVSQKFQLTLPFKHIDVLKYKSQMS
jgi:hypothetical protein